MSIPTWKKNIFVRAINLRIKMEDKTAEELVNTYPLLTKDEKVEILKEISKQV